MVLADMSALERRVRDFSVARHAAAGCRYGAHPYEVHLAAVRQVLADYGYSHDLRCAAWAHDLLEDTPTTRSELTEVAGSHVASLAWAVTGEGATRLECWASVQPKLRQYPLAVYLKIADRIANVEASRASSPRLLKMYQREQATFRADLDAIIRGNLDLPYDMWDRLDQAINQETR